MKKLIKLLMPVVISLSASGASIDYLMNNSSVYLGNPAQTANISVESAFFNPAGLVYLDDGLYLNINAFLSSVEESTVLDGRNTRLMIFRLLLVLIWYIKKKNSHTISIQAL